MDPYFTTVPVHAHRAPDLPVPIDEPETAPGHHHDPDAPGEEEEPVPDHKPE
ncbi:hypothetical protein IP91_04707 [Pseudoduganella lurida]|uniref:Uncharacterized protein n=1 Tax=Pseudoduganella lurida TaxID=1036180 RepID=A0A562QY55_9BURK|nr:hypothetical protein [Pseudoduganella lurida]TWI61120.1 hypothetical protein IP91_04707 [Pseudoduganella lurida]